MRTKNGIYKVGNCVKYNYPWDCVCLPRGVKGKVQDIRLKQRDPDFYEVPEKFNDRKAIKDPYEYKVEWFEIDMSKVTVDEDNNWHPAVDLVMCRDMCETCGYFLKCPQSPFMFFCKTKGEMDTHLCNKCKLRFYCWTELPSCRETTFIAKL